MEATHTGEGRVVYAPDRQPSQHEIEKTWQFMCRLLGGDFYRIEIEIAAGKNDELHIKGLKRVV